MICQKMICWLKCHCLGGAKREIAVCDMCIVTNSAVYKFWFLQPDLFRIMISHIWACGVRIYVARYSELWLGVQVIKCWLWFKRLHLDMYSFVNTLLYCCWVWWDIYLVCPNTTYIPKVVVWIRNILCIERIGLIFVILTSFDYLQHCIIHCAEINRSDYVSIWDRPYFAISTVCCKETRPPISCRLPFVRNCLTFSCWTVQLHWYFYDTLV
jgi:hypothetical protein